MPPPAEEHGGGRGDREDGASWHVRWCRFVGGRDCCWYHGGDWHRGSGFAIRLVREAQRAGTARTGVCVRTAGPEAPGLVLTQLVTRVPLK
ncbi:hypothetical protein [Micromonospora sp. NPDC005299]|uniref:hypothetical protein n=1 Tax=Micromonospora sp. NPDC005299 TaxID=3364231 RepID=UPI003698FE65